MSNTPNQGPGEHDAHLMDDDRSKTVPCAHCGQPVWEYAQRCPQCGTHFRGEAWEFHKASKSDRSTRLPITVIIVIGLMAIAYLLRKWF